MFTKALMFLTTTAALAASTFAQTPLSIDTPVVARQCIPTEITWHGGSGLFFLLVKNSSDVPIQEFGGLSADTHSLLWNTNVREHTVVHLALNDETGATVETAPFVIRHGRNNCTLAN